MAHIFFIDPIEKLNVKKDSTLMMALTFQQQGHDCRLLFEDDFFITNDGLPKLKLYSFKGEFKEKSFYLESFELLNTNEEQLSNSDIIHMRIDPPYDSRYQRYLWMLEFLQNSGVRVVNNPIGIMNNNEKLVAFKEELSPRSYIGPSLQGMKDFVAKLKNEKVCDELIMKPLDLYSGIGVEKVSIEDAQLYSKFQNKVKEFEGAIIVQPFIKEVYKGELRSIYYAGKEIGTIIKYPVEGSYLSNVAQGASFEKIELPAPLRECCEKIAWELKEQGVDFIAFDLLGGKVTEVNVTCPGLIVEVSTAMERNLALDICKYF